MCQCIYKHGSVGIKFWGAMELVNEVKRNGDFGMFFIADWFISFCGLLHKQGFTDISFDLGYIDDTTDTIIPFEPESEWENKGTIKAYGLPNVVMTYENPRYNRKGDVEAPLMTALNALKTLDKRSTDRNYNTVYEYNLARNWAITEAREIYMQGLQSEFMDWKQNRFKGEIADVGYKNFTPLWQKKVFANMTKEQQNSIPMIKWSEAKKKGYTDDMLFNMWYENVVKAYGGMSNTDIYEMYYGTSRRHEDTNLAKLSGRRKPFMPFANKRFKIMRNGRMKEVA